MKNKSIEQYTELFTINQRAVKKSIPIFVSRLISDIYDNIDKSPYDNPEVRIGLCLRAILMIKSKYSLDFEFVQPVIDDIELLLNNEEYLSKFEDVETRKEILRNEKNILTGKIHLDDLSLNTTGL